MSLHGSSFNPDATQPLPPVPPRMARETSPAVWTPPAMPSPKGPGAGYRGWSPPGGWWQPPGGGSPPSGGWQPPGGGWQPTPPRPPRRGIAALAVLVAVVLVGTLVAVALNGRRFPGRASLGTSATPPAGATAPPSPSPLPSPSPPPPPKSASTISTEVAPSVVDINSKLASGGTAAGTGMVLTPAGEILTNNHVINGAIQIRVQIVTSKRTYPAVVVGTDAADDVAVLQVQASGLTPIPLGDSSRVNVGEPVVALGNAQGLNGLPSVASGSIVALDQSITASDPGAGLSENLSGLLQTDAPLQPGDSGGPLINGRGLVIGMDTAASAHVQSGPPAGFAIPINTALALAAKIVSGQINSSAPSVTTGFLGISVATVSDGAKIAGPRYIAPVATGAFVADVIAGSPANAAGLMSGDIIQSVNGTPVATPGALTSALRGHHAGEAVQLVWVTAAGRSRAAQVRLGVPPPN